MVRLIVSILMLAFVVSLALGKTHRDPAQRAAYMQQHPCPSIGKTKGGCPGYDVDRVKPLSACGPDHPSNMQ